MPSTTVAPAADEAPAPLALTIDLARPWPLPPGPGPPEPPASCQDSPYPDGVT